MPVPAPILRGVGRATRGYAGFTRFWAPFAAALAIALIVLSCSDTGTNPDTVPPARVTDLALQNTSSGILATWTAPGDDGRTGRVAHYDIRYAAGDLVAGWDSATVVPPPISPAKAGAQEFVMVSGLAPGTWRFGLKSADEAPNWSDLSNIPSITITAVVVDTIAPAAVTDLAVEGITRSSVDLRWTATGDDSTSGTAAGYELRYAVDSISPETWDDATIVPGLGPPARSGETETFTVGGLAADRTYAFALKVTDEAGNVSGLSNTVDARVVFLGPAQLTFNTTYYGGSSPDWSPDGRSILFVGGYTLRPEMTRPQIFVVAAEGGDPVRYTTFEPEGADSPRWSPTGDRFVFSKGTPVGNRTIGVLAVMDAAPGATYRVLANHDPGSVTSPRWSPDGSRIAYAIRTGTPPDPQISIIHTVSAEGVDPVSVVTGLRLAGFDWSPDGTRLVYAARADSVYDLWTVPVEGGEPTRLTSGPGNRKFPAWSPDGTEIAYAGAEFANAASETIWILPAAGGEARRATTDSGQWMSDPAWSPDGTKLAYAKHAEGRTNIWVAPVE